MIGKFLIIPFCLVASMATTMLPHAAHAQGSALEKVAIVDIQRILQEAQAANSIREQFKKLTVELGQKARKIREELKAQEKDLAAKRTILAPERMAQLVNELRERAKTEQATFNQLKRAHDESVKAAMGKVQKVFENVAAEIAQEQSFSIVFRKGSVVLAPKASDITSELLKRLNKKLPEVKVEPLKPKQPKGK